MGDLTAARAARTARLERKKMLRLVEQLETGAAQLRAAIEAQPGAELELGAVGAQLADVAQVYAALLHLEHACHARTCAAALAP